MFSLDTADGYGIVVDVRKSSDVYRYCVLIHCTWIDFCWILRLMSCIFCSHLLYFNN